MSLAFKILFSVLIAFVLTFSFEQIIAFGLKNNDNFKITHISRNDINADILFHGPCQSEWTINPEYLKTYGKVNAFNLGMANSDFADNFLFLHTYLKNQKKPKCVFLYVSPESFDSSITNSFNTYRFSYSLNDPIVKDVILDLDRDYMNYVKLPNIKYSFYSNNTYFKSIKGWTSYMSKNQNIIYPTGYVAPYHEYNKHFNNYLDINPKPITFSWTPQREKYFLKIVQLLKKKEIKLILYESPIYYEALNYHLNREEILAKIDSLCSKLNIPYLRFDTLSMRFDNTCYFSDYNFTLKGNNTFNKFLAKYLKDHPNLMKN